MQDMRIEFNQEDINNFFDDKVTERITGKLAELGLVEYAKAAVTQIDVLSQEIADLVQDDVDNLEEQNKLDKKIMDAKSFLMRFFDYLESNIKEGFCTK